MAVCYLFSLILSSTPNNFFFVFQFFEILRRGELWFCHVQFNETFHICMVGFSSMLKFFFSFFVNITLILYVRVYGLSVFGGQNACAYKLINLSFVFVFFFRKFWRHTKKYLASTWDETRQEVNVNDKRRFIATGMDSHKYFPICMWSHPVIYSQFVVLVFVFGEEEKINLILVFSFKERNHFVSFSFELNISKWWKKLWRSYWKNYGEVVEKKWWNFLFFLI